MKDLERETVEKIESEFKQLKKKGKMDVDDQERILYNLSGLLGWYAQDYNPKIRNLIKEMIAFSDSQLWDTGSYELSFKQIEKKREKYEKNKKAT